MKENLNQLSFTDIYSNIDEYFQQDKPKLIKLFEQHIDLQNLIPQSFYNHYHADTGHPRIYKFGSGEDSKIYIGSADLMTRNTERRVEIAVPLLDEEVRNKVKNYLYDQWKDNTKARNLTCEGVYRPIDTKPSDKLINAQEEMMRISIEQAKLVEEEMAPVEVPKESIFDKIKRFFS